MKHFKTKILFGSLAVVGSSAHASSAVDQYLAAIDLGTVAASIIAIGVIIVGISMSEKGMSIAKRVIRKA